MKRRRSQRVRLVPRPNLITYGIFVNSTVAVVGVFLLVVR